MDILQRPLLRDGIFLAGSQPAPRLQPGGKSLHAASLQLLPAAADAPCGSDVPCVHSPLPSHAPVTNSLLMGTWSLIRVRVYR